MAEILPFKRPKASAKHRGRTLCAHNHHKWVVDKDALFDTHKGALVTRYRCTRCGKTRTVAH